jgi:ferric-dicitrate binding protein FerR (iron transport regulator)
MTKESQMEFEPSNAKLEDLLLDQSFREYIEETNAASVAFWKEWILAHPENTGELNKATLVMKTLLGARKIPVLVNKEESLKLLIKQIDQQQNNSGGFILRLNSLWLRIAAIAIILMAVASTWYWINDHSQKGKSILAYNEIVVPLGEKARINLADGTSVWINSDSKLRFPEKFGPDSREVFLEGEAFFDVTKKAHANFIVHTRLSDVKVLGTAFNVKCYAKDLKTQTTVVRGLVQVISKGEKQLKTFIKPNEMLTIKTNSGESMKVETVQTTLLSKVETKNIISWKDQMLTFTGESFDDLTLKMERWFNVVIVIKDEKLKTERFRGKFSHNENVFEVLEAIKVTTPITYKVENDTIFVRRRN